MGRESRPDRLLLVWSIYAHTHWPESRGDIQGTRGHGASHRLKLVDGATHTTKSAPELLGIAQPIVVAVASSATRRTHQEVMIRCEAFSPIKLHGVGVGAAGLHVTLVEATTCAPIPWRRLVDWSWGSVVVEAPPGIAPNPSSAVEGRGGQRLARVRLSVISRRPGSFARDRGQVSGHTETLKIGLRLGNSRLCQLLVQLGYLVLGLGKLQLQAQNFLGLGASFVESGTRRASGWGSGWERVRRRGHWQGAARGGVVQVSRVHDVGVAVLVPCFESFAMVVKGGLLLRELGEELVHGIGVDSASVLNHQEARCVSLKIWTREKQRQH